MILPPRGQAALGCATWPEPEQKAQKGSPLGNRHRSGKAA
jgi:hypothetical protein